MGKSKTDPHTRNKGRASEAPIITIKYSYLTDEETLQSMLTLNIIDRHSDYFRCEIVPKKGAGQRAATILCMYMENTGYNKIMFKVSKKISC